MSDTLGWSVIYCISQLIRKTRNSDPEGYRQSCIEAVTWRENLLHVRVDRLCVPPEKGRRQRVAVSVPTGLTGPPFRTPKRQFQRRSGAAHSRSARSLPPDPPEARVYNRPRHQSKRTRMCGTHLFDRTTSLVHRRLRPVPTDSGTLDSTRQSGRFE